MPERLDQGDLTPPRSTGKNWGLHSKREVAPRGHVECHSKRLAAHVFPCVLPLILPCDSCCVWQFTFSTRSLVRVGTALQRSHCGEFVKMDTTFTSNEWARAFKLHWGTPETSGTDGRTDGLMDGRTDGRTRISKDRERRCWAGSTKRNVKRIPWWRHSFMINNTEATHENNHSNFYHRAHKPWKYFKFFLIES